MGLYGNLWSRLEQVTSVDADGVVSFSGGISIPSTESIAVSTIVFASGSVLKGESASDTYLIAASGKDIHLQSHANQGGKTRLWIDTAGRLTLSDVNGVGQIRVGTSGFDAAANSPVSLEHGATVASGEMLTCEVLQLTGIASTPNPANGAIRLWADTDDNFFKITDQASTDATITHGIIDIVA